MNALLDRLRAHHDRPLLGDAQGLVSSHDFVRRVDRCARALDSAITGRRVLVEASRAVDVYSAVFAVVARGATAIFPYPKHEGATGLHDTTLTVRDDDVAIKYAPAKPPLPEGCEVVCFSSGSTGRPKGVCHRLTHFIANAKAVLERMDVDHGHSITALEPGLVSAFAHFLVHALGDRALTFIAAHDPAALAAAFENHPESAIIGSPMHIQAALARLQHIETARPRMWFSSGDFIYRKTIERALDQSPDSVFFKVYGLAELAGRCCIQRITRDSGSQVYNELGLPLSSCSLGMKDDQLTVDSGHLFLGYLTEQGFVPAVRPHPTGDVARATGHALELVGRSDDVVKVGGQKLALRGIESRIHALLEPATCVLVPTTHPEFGTLLTLVIDSPTRLRRSNVLKRLRHGLKTHELPHRLRYAGDLPMTRSRKIDRRSLGAQLEQLEEVSEQ